MSKPARINRHAWLVVPLLALAFVVLTTVLRVRRVEYVGGLAGRPASAAPGPAGGGSPPWQPRLIVPGQHAESFEWLDQARQMFAFRQWRVRHVDFENALSGREVYASCPYRWWIGLLALCHHAVTGSPAGPSVEWSAVYADPLLLLVFGAATVAFAARRFGAWAAALISAALASLFPFGTEFLPGVPDDHALIEACTVWSILPLLAGASAQGAGARRRWFLAGGIAGGVAMWISVPRQLPILFGIALGGILAAWAARPRAGAETGEERVSLPWRAWGIAGAATCLGAYLLEFFPSYMGNWELRAVHPIFGVAWIGGAELLARTTGWIGGETRKWSIRGVAAWVLGAAAFASLPAAMGIGHNLGLLAIELPTMRLSLLPESASAANLWAWLLQNGLTAQVLATVIPVVILAPAAALLLRRSLGAGPRISIALAIGPVLAAAALGIRQISWWNGVDAALLALLAAAAAPLALAPVPRWLGCLSGGFAAAVLLPGAFQLWPSWEAHTNQGLSKTEVVGLVERDLAYTLGKRVGPAGAVVLAPPELTSALYYYGGLKGLATFGWENFAGFQSAVRISSATTPEEAQELIGVHGVTHILIPTWDPFMDAFAQIGAGQVAGTFLERLHQWNLPRWLTPVPYLVPAIEGFEGQSVVILEVVEEQDDATALSRVAVYLADMGQFELASKAGAALRRFPADLGALLAQAQVETACGEKDAFSKSVDQLVRRISGGADRDLAWDQRVGLAVVLAQAQRLDLARPRLRQCLAEIDEANLRSISTILLYRLQLLRKALRLEIDDPALRALSLDLLPPEMRARVE